jgi:hypothetical protein
MFNKTKRLEERVEILEDNELQDLKIMSGMSNRVLDLEWMLENVLEKNTESYQSIHKILIALMEYLKVDFNEDGKLVKSKKKKYDNKIFNKVSKL